MRVTKKRMIAGILLLSACPLLLAIGCPIVDNTDTSNQEQKGGQDEVLDERECPLINGTGTNPGPGDGAVIVLLHLEGDIGSVTYSPLLPTTLQTNYILRPFLQQRLSFLTCPEQINLGNVIFEDDTGQKTDLGEIVFQRSTDYTCGQTLSVTFSLPCNIDIELE